MHPLVDLARRLRAERGSRSLAEALEAGEAGLRARGAPGVLTPLAVAMLAQEAGHATAWIITPDVIAARRHARDLEALRAAGVVPASAVVLPALEGDPYAFIAPHDNVQRERVATLEALATPPVAGSTRIVLVPARSLLVPLPPPDRTAREALTLEAGAEFPPEDVAAALVEAGYVATDVVSTWGEFSRRGSVLDVFPPDAEAPLRAEYWGDEITELRRFDPETQRSIGNVARARIGAVREAAPDHAIAGAFAARLRERVRTHGLAPRAVERMLAALEEHESFPGFELLRWSVDAGVPPLAHAGDALVVWDRPDQIEAEIATFREEMEGAWSEELRAFVPGPAEILVAPETIAAARAAASLAIEDIAWSDTAGPGAHDLGGRSVSRHGGDLAGWLRVVEAHLKAGGSAALVLASRGRLERMRSVLVEASLGERLAWMDGDPDITEEAAAAPGRISLGLGLVETGASIGGLLVHAEGDVFGDMPAPRKERKRKTTAFRPADLRDLKRGDLMVHVDHGIGRFDGIKTMGEGAEARDFLVLLYADEDKLYVPLDRLDLVERYSGVGGLTARLDRLGGTTWEKVKRSVKKAMVDMARELLDLYAARQAVRAFRFSQDGDWQRDFEGAFPFDMTDDQDRALADVKADMQSERPMDRLIVGDVGFGKTEVAVRAVFKAVMDGKQVAFLAPTTVLALQHQTTLARRFAAWPARIELLSRFRTPAQQAATLARLKSGECDVVVGTHRLLSKDVRFKDLALLVVDEEQRFGVRHKERLKALRKDVHVLTLTATPIPRTLSMALGGIRDMSVIETPPVGRHAIQTSVLPFSTDVIAAACRQELDRGGQVYFVHDRVQSIYSLAGLVRELVPGARIGVAHGQMPEQALEEAMVLFLRGETDILVATTVIENGLDIPRANTIIVNRADRHGLAQLYQLRGRVGRSDRQAHAFLFVPAKVQLSDEARRRLAALQEFTDLGSGFRIAALDLEIRGAGNVLGGEQSGHMASVGFDMYVRLLEEAVRDLKGQPQEAAIRAQVSVPLDLRLPDSYIAEEAQRLSVYKRFATVRDADELLLLEQETRDRYGNPPEALERLSEHARLRLRAERLRVVQLEADSRAIKLRFAKDTKVHPQAIMRVLQERPGATFAPDGTLTVPLAGADWRDGAWELLREVG